MASCLGSEPGFAQTCATKNIKSSGTEYIPLNLGLNIPVSPAKYAGQHSNHYALTLARVPPLAQKLRQKIISN